MDIYGCVDRANVARLCPDVYRTYELGSMVMFMTPFAQSRGRPTAREGTRVRGIE